MELFTTWVTQIKFFLNTPLGSVLFFLSLLSPALFPRSDRGNSGAALVPYVTQGDFPTVEIKTVNDVQISGLIFLRF